MNNRPNYGDPDYEEWYLHNIASIKRFWKDQGKPQNVESASCDFDTEDEMNAAMARIDHIWDKKDNERKT